MDGHIANIKPEIITDIEVLLEFVERWNKKDAEREVAAAAYRVQDYLDAYKVEEDK